MGRPRIKTIDDSQAEAEEKKKQPSKKATIDDGKIEDSTSKIEDGRSNETILSSTLNPQNTTLHPLPSTVKKANKPGKAKPRSKKYQEVVKDLDRSKLYPLDGAVDMAKKMSYAKFNATLEAHITTAQTGIRGLVSLPYASGRQLRILAFGPSQTPKLPGVIFGSDEAIEEINKRSLKSSQSSDYKGKVDFDLIITTPDWMPKLAKVARILGPRGLMPNPKNGTITNDLKKAVESFQAGKTEYRTESKAPVIHVALGKLNQPNEELMANIKTLLQTLGKSRVKKVTLSPTMGPGVKVDLSSI